MPSVNRLRLVLQAACLAALAGLTLTAPAAIASPLPVPTWKIHPTDLVQRSNLTARAYDDLSYVANNTRSGIAKHVIADYDAMPSSSLQKRQGVDNFLSNLNMLDSYSTQINQNAQTISMLCCILYCASSHVSA